MAAAKATARRTQLTLKTYTRFPRRQLPPLFLQTYGMVYPDTRDDVLGGPVKKIKYEAVVLENPHIRVTLVPDLGAKIWSVYDKHAKRETLHVPDCVKPGMIMLCGAWIAGGMEVNFPIGHHIDSMSRVPIRLVQDSPDQAAAVFERTCRRTGLHIEVQTILRSDQACFDLVIRVDNPTAIAQRWYQWTNVGVTAGDNWRFFSKGDLYTGGTGIDTYPVDGSGKDISWYRNRPDAGDNFMVGLQEDYFGCYDFAKEHGLAHWAPWRQIPGKKYFTWGSTHRSYDSGRNLNDTGDDYLEIQTGPMETQNHFEMLAPGQEVSFTGTWMPYRQIGGIEWACRELLLNVRDGVPWLYATQPVDAEITIAGRTHRAKLDAGQVMRLRNHVRKGTSIAVTIDGQELRRWKYPLVGRMERSARQRSLQEQKLFDAAWQTTPPKTAVAGLALARQMVKYDINHRAVSAYRKALAMKPTLHEARLELAETLFRVGDFRTGVKELQPLLTTKVAPRAQDLLARRAAAEAAWMAPVLAQPIGRKRDLALAERFAGYGAFERAAAIYKKLLKTDPRNPRVHFGQAIYLWRVKKDLSKAAEHADRALHLRPGDRDLLLEFAPLYAQAGQHERLIEQVGKATPAVRNLSLLQKQLARAYFETGQLAKSWKIFTTVRLYNWEGEFAHVQVYVDCALALAEQALRKGDLATARHMVEMAADPSKAATLGVLRDYGSSEQVRFWQGLIAMHEGNRREALRLWQSVADPLRKTKRLPLDLGVWHVPPRPQNQYLRVMCVHALGEAKATTHAIDLLQRMRDDWAAATVETHAAPLDLLDGMLAELRGDFTESARCFERHIAKAADKQIARMHLAAVQAGGRHMGPLPACTHATSGQR